MALRYYIYIHGYYILGYIIIYIHYIQYDTIIGYMSHDITDPVHCPVEVLDVHPDVQRLMAQGIIGRSSEIYGRRFKETYETPRGAVRDFGYMNIK